jgi:DNA-binding response OmpR family regulator
MSTAADPLRILVVDDEPKIAAFVQEGLRDAGYAAWTCHDGLDALELAASDHFHAVVLDILIPGCDGLGVLRELRARRNPVPVMLLTALHTTADRIAGLNLGADDYLPKPFSIDELIARLRAIWRRQAGEAGVVLACHDLTLHPVTRKVRRGDQTIELTTREFALLEYFLRSPGRVHHRSDLCLHVWGCELDADTNLVDVCVQRLRRKVDADRPDRLIHTVRGVGYTLRAGS